MHPPLPQSTEKELWPTFYSSLTIGRLAAQNIQTESMTVMSRRPSQRENTCVRATEREQIHIHRTDSMQETTEKQRSKQVGYCQGGCGAEYAWHISDNLKQT